MFTKKHSKTATGNNARPAKKVLSALATILLIVSTLLCFAVVISTMIGGSDAGLFGHRLFYVITGSMEPTLPEGSLLVVAPQSSYAERDIITFYSKDEAIEGYPNTHRIIEVVTLDGKTLYRTKGDANNTEDEVLVAPEDIIGIVRFSVQAPFLKSLIGFLNSPFGFFAAILIPLLLFALFSMRDFARAMREEMRRAAEKEARAEIEAEQKEEND